MPTSTADDLIRQSGGDVAKLEALLGLEAGDLGVQPVRIDVSEPTGLRISNGNEKGANEFWIPGGYTSGGILEATIDSPPPGSFTVETIFD